MNTNALPNAEYVVCIRNDDYEYDLALNKVYRVLPDESAARSGWIRVVDETGEDYLYPGEFFQPVDVSQVAEMRGAA